MDTPACHLFVYKEKDPCTTITKTGIRRELLFFGSIYIFWSILGNRELLLSHRTTGVCECLDTELSSFQIHFKESFSEQEEILATAKQAHPQQPSGTFNQFLKQL